MAEDIEIDRKEISQADVDILCIESDILGALVSGEDMKDVPGDARKLARGWRLERVRSRRLRQELAEARWSAGRLLLTYERELLDRGFPEAELEDCIREANSSAHAKHLVNAFLEVFRRAGSIDNYPLELRSDEAAYTKAHAECVKAVEEQLTWERNPNQDPLKDRRTELEDYWDPHG